jgi:hypothetical protein
MKNKIIKLVVAVMFASACIGFAEEEKGKGPRPKGPGPGGPEGGPGGPERRPNFQPPKLADIDTDASGDINKEEWVAFQVKMAKERSENSFDMIAGEDGKISEEDLKKMMARQREGGPRPPFQDGKGKGEGKGEGDRPKRPAPEA